MKKSIIMLSLIAVCVLITGCGNNKEFTKKCVIHNDVLSQGYKLDSEYNIFGKGRVETTEIVTSDNQEILDYFEDYLNDTYVDANENYGGYTKINVTNSNNKVVSNIEIDYTKMDLEKFVQDNPGVSAYINSNNAMTTEGIVSMYEALGATCE